MKQILIIDDDMHIGNMEEELLTREGYEVRRAYSGTEAAMAVAAHKPDLILLDLMLPGISGEELLPEIKDIPVIVVSAKIDIDSKVDLLMGGAADYITKPFNTKELLARISVALRNSKGKSGLNAEILSFDDILLNTVTHETTVCGNAVRLTKTEFAILKLLMHNPKQVVAKSVILDRISADTPDCVESSLKVHISNLRRKLREQSGKDYIEAVWGIGFKMKS